MKRSLFLPVLGLLCLGIAGCEVDLRDTGEVPDVDVQGGRAPDAEIRGPEIETGEREITVPTIEGVRAPEENESATQ